MSPMRQAFGPQIVEDRNNIRPPSRTSMTEEQKLNQIDFDEENEESSSPEKKGLGIGPLGKSIKDFGNDDQLLKCTYLKWTKS